MEVNKIYQGDCIKRLSQLESNSVDLIYFEKSMNLVIVGNH